MYTHAHRNFVLKSDIDTCYYLFGFKKNMKIKLWGKTTINEQPPGLVLPLLPQLYDPRGSRCSMVPALMANTTQMT